MSQLPSSSSCVTPWVHVFGDERGLLRPTAPDGSAPTTLISSLDVRLGNACNYLDEAATTA